MIGQLIRFIGVGGLATLVHVLAAMTAQGLFAISAQQANLAGFCTAVLVSYAGHARITFAADLRDSGQFARFVAMSLLALALSSAEVWLFGTRLGLGFGATMVIVGITVPILSFVALRFWVFHRGHIRDRTDLQGIFLSLAMALAMLALFWGRMINHDTAWYLIATRKWLAGATLYVDLVEVNPPLNFYLTAPVIALADLLGISETNAQYVILSLILYFSLAWCGKIMLTHHRLTGARRAGLVAGIAIAVILPALNNIGQREHLLTMFLMPWVVGLMSPRAALPRQAMSRAAFAAVGVCLKPHFVVFPLGTTALACWQDRTLRPILSIENLTFLAVGSGYVLFVALVHPLYLTEIVGLASQVYGAYRGDLAKVVLALIPQFLLLLPVLTILLSQQKTRDVRVPAVLSLAGLASYLLQGTGFAYHAIPFQSFGLLTCFWLLSQQTRSLHNLLTATLAVVGVVALAITRGFYANGVVEEVSAVTKEMGTVRHLMVLSTNVSAGPVVALGIGAGWSSRYPANWLLPGAMNRLAKLDCTTSRDTCDVLAGIAQRNRSDNIADIVATRPELLIIDRKSGYFDPPGFDWLRFMAEDPAWAPLFAEYRELKVSDRLTYYQRQPDDGQ